MNALVLGGNGFIGSHLVDRLLREGHAVHVFDRQPERYRKPLAGVVYHIQDFGNRALLAAVLPKIDMVFHLVSTTVPKTSNDDPAFDVMSNVVETICLLEQCVKGNVKKVIFVSTGGAVYGTPATLPVSEDSPESPESSYGITKLAIEKYLGLFHRLYGLNYVILRPSNPYGERQNPDGDQGVIAVFLGKIAKGQAIDIWGDGSSVKDFIYIADLIDGMYRAAFSDTVHRVFNMGSGIGHSVNDIARMITEKVGRPVSVNHLPKGAFDVSRIYLDIARARNELGWEPKISLEDGLRRTWEFVKNSGSPLE
ncbi:MAG: NAD-dependent epimerase/dehydratase family protein [Deltaproteobacteria bacterium]|nr:NAD-dependent epimerase/dehydratase family protein [Deltaproteobacteria bacterium]